VRKGRSLDGQRRECSHLLRAELSLDVARDSDLRHAEARRPEPLITRDVAIQDGEIGRRSSAIHRLLTICQAVSVPSMRVIWRIDQTDFIARVWFRQSVA
jgi:hypothetical protein